MDTKNGFALLCSGIKHICGFAHMHTFAFLRSSPRLISPLITAWILELPDGLRNFCQGDAQPENDHYLPY